MLIGILELLSISPVLMVCFTVSRRKKFFIKTTSIYLGIKVLVAIDGNRTDLSSAKSTEFSQKVIDNRDMIKLNSTLL